MDFVDLAPEVSCDRAKILGIGMEIQMQAQSALSPH